MDKIINELNDAQKAALVADGHILVLAGAGSGKTRVLTYRIAQLVNKYNVRPHEILAITFTNKASAEMKERLSVLTDCAHLMWISTIHSMCAKILRFEAQKIGYTSDFSIYTEQESEKTVKRVITALGWKDDELNLKNILWHISTAKTLMLDSAQYAEQFSYVRDIDKIEKIYQKYTAELKACNAMDFDDLLLNVFTLFKKNEEVRQKYAMRFRYISVDEFQDTNTIQYEILKMLQSHHQNLFAVGDDDQSIYGWRGAEIKNILNFHKDFTDAKVFKLEQNYRSTKKILHAANAVISKNSQRHGKQLWTENGDGVKVETYCGYDESEEAYYVANQISALVRYSGMRYGDFAVLMRVNALTRTVEQEFQKYGIPFKVYGGFKFFERKEIKDILAYFKLISNPADNEAFLRAVNTPKRGIGGRTVETLLQLSVAHGMSLMQVLEDGALLSKVSSAAAKLAGFRNLIHELDDYRHTHNLVEFAKHAIEATDLKKSFEDENDADRIMNLNEFLASVNDFARLNPDASVSDFVNSVTLSAERAEGEEDDNFVALATIHAVKGLEFRTVFVIGLDDTVFPLSRAQYDNNEMEEERRLMYVAVTRARERLYLTRCKVRFLYGERRPMLPSAFYRDVEEATGARPATNTILQEIDAAPQKSKKADADISAYQPGTKVRHAVFGDGVVLTRNGDNADVSFKNVGVKTLALKFAPLEILR